MPDDLRQKIKDVASGPASVSGDEGSVTAQNLEQLIRADKYLREQDAAGQRRLPIRIGRINPGGAV